MEYVIQVAKEQSATGIMLHLIDMPGGFTRGENLDIAMSKIITEAKSYHQWKKELTEQSSYGIQIVQSEITNAQIHDG
jgi:hypothetical protein